MEKRIVVLGVGNILRGDDGLGVHAVELLRREALPPRVALLDAGTMGIDLLYLIEDADYAIIIDALDAGAEPGATFRIPWEAIADHEPAAQVASLHDYNLVTVLALAKKLGKMPQVVIYGVQPENTELGYAMSEAVTGALPGLVQSVKAEIREMGCNNVRA